jgi:predicted O-linked N-acetylglucosamine transferase (SPINDLY family)
LERRALSSGRGLAANFRLDLNRTGRREAVAAPPPKLDSRHEGTVDALVQLGLALHQQGRLVEARDFYRQALQRQPRHFSAMHLLGVLAAQSKEPQRAVELIGEALSIDARSAPAHNNYGNALRELGRYEAAIRSFDTAIQLHPGYAEAYCNRGLVLAELKRHDAAIQNFGQALVLRPRSAEIHMSRGNSLRELGQYEAAVASYEQAIALKPDYPEAHAARGIALFGLRRYDEALAGYDAALALKPDLKNMDGLRLYTKLQICDWSGLDAEVARLTAKIARGEAATFPLCAMTLSDSAALHRRAAELWVRQEFPRNPALAEIPRYTGHERIRIGYFSADFREHAVSSLIAGLFESHDRSRFELTAFSLGREVRDGMRARIEKAFDRFVDAQTMSDPEIVQLARRLEIDIAVDLGGYSEAARPAIFAMRAAPLQVGYLGYPGTSGSDCIDYLAADLTLIPPEEQRHYSEKIIYLPDSYQVNDRARSISDTKFTRAEFGLPPAGFVFCCFNNSYKIVPACFHAWMRILTRVPDSVLWLSDLNPFAKNNLRREAERRGVSAERLVFAQRMPSSPDHLARQRLADLFLDTLPYNAHTTASDALWAGLPVLTCIGNAFPGRVAASLLRAIQLPELIAQTPSQYEDLAVEMANDTGRLGDIRLRLADNRTRAPLFDTQRFTTHLEAAYREIHARKQAGMPAGHWYPNDPCYPHHPD